MVGTLVPISASWAVVALHRVFYSPDDAIIWDTGHQAYVHKILTGRSPRHVTPRGRLSGCPSREESAMTSSRTPCPPRSADGLAKAWERRGLLGSRHVAVIGDGAMTRGMAWEALNNIAASNRPVLIVERQRAVVSTTAASPTISQHCATRATTSAS